MDQKNSLISISRLRRMTLSEFLKQDNFKLNVFERPHLDNDGSIYKATYAAELVSVSTGKVVVRVRFGADTIGQAIRDLVKIINSNAGVTMCYGGTYPYITELGKEVNDVIMDNLSIEY